MRKKSRLRHQRLTMLPALLSIAAGAACSAPVFVRVPTPQTPAPESAAKPASALEASVERGLLPEVQVRGEPVQSAVLADRMAALKVPGLSMAVFDETGVVWAKGYGVADVESGEKVGVGTLFQAGSISKSVNALAVLLAASDGSFGLDQPVNELLKSWQLPENELTKKSPVTLRQLLSHTAGTTVHGFPGYPSGAPLPTLVEVLDGRAPANTPPVRVDLLPGSQFRYSGGGISISQLVLMDTFSRPYAELMAERVLRPLGLSSSTYEQPLPPERLALAAAGHLEDGSLVPSRRHVYPEMAAAGLWTTATDLALFFREIALARAGHSKKIPQSVALQMTTEVVAGGNGPGERPGLGVFLQHWNGAGLFDHGGVDEGFTAFVLASLDGSHGLAFMTNSANGMRLFPEIERTVFASMTWPGADEPVTRVALNGAQRTAWIGAYTEPDGVPLSFRADGERLLLVRPFQAPEELVPVAPNRVIERSRGIRYLLDEDGLKLEMAGTTVGKAKRVAAGEQVPLIALAEGREQEAIQAWRARLGPNGNPTPQMLLPSLRYAQELLQEGNAAAAVTILQVMATVFPTLPQIHAADGGALAAAGRHADAVQAYETALARLADATWLPPGEREGVRKRIEQGLSTERAKSQR